MSSQVQQQGATAPVLDGNTTTQNMINTAYNKLTGLETEKQAALEGVTDPGQIMQICIQYDSQIAAAYSSMQKQLTEREKTDKTFSSEDYQNVMSGDFGTFEKETNLENDPTFQQALSSLSTSTEGKALVNAIIAGCSSPITASGLKNSAEAILSNTQEFLKNYGSISPDELTSIENAFNVFHSNPGQNILNIVQYNNAISGLQKIIQNDPQEKNYAQTLLNIIQNKFDADPSNPQNWSQFEKFLNSPYGFTAGGVTYSAARDLYFYFPSATQDQLNDLASAMGVANPVPSVADSTLLTLNSLISNPGSLSTSDLSSLQDMKSLLLSMPNKSQLPDSGAMQWFENKITCDDDNDCFNTWSQISSTGQQQIRGAIQQATGQPFNPPTLTGSSFVNNIHGWANRKFSDKSETSSIQAILNDLGSNPTLAQVQAFLSQFGPNHDIFAKFPGLTLDAYDALYNAAGVTAPDLTQSQQMECYCQGLNLYGDKGGVGKNVNLTKQDQANFGILAKYLANNPTATPAELIAEASSMQFSNTAESYLKWITGQPDGVQPHIYRESGEAFSNNGRDHGQVLPKTATVSYDGQEITVPINYYENVIVTGNDESTTGSEREVTGYITLPNGQTEKYNQFITDDHYETYYQTLQLGSSNYLFTIDDNGNEVLNPQVAQDIQTGNYQDIQQIVNNQSSDPDFEGEIQQLVRLTGLTQDQLTGANGATMTPADLNDLGYALQMWLNDDLPPDTYEQGGGSAGTGGHKKPSHTTHHHHTTGPKMTKENRTLTHLTTNKV